MARSGAPPVADGHTTVGTAEARQASEASEARASIGVSGFVKVFVGCCRITSPVLLANNQEFLSGILVAS